MVYMTWLAERMVILHIASLCEGLQWVVIGWLWVQLTINLDELFLDKNCPSPKDENNLKFRNNETQLIVNCANNHPITSLSRGQLYEINERKRDVYKKYYEPYN